MITLTRMFMYVIVDVRAELTVIFGGRCGNGWDGAGIDSSVVQCGSLSDVADDEVTS